MSHTPSSAYSKGREDERNALIEMIKDIVKTNPDVRNLPGHLVLQVLAASLTPVTEKDNDADVSTTSDN